MTVKETDRMTRVLFFSLSPPLSVHHRQHSGRGSCSLPCPQECHCATFFQSRAPASPPLPATCFSFPPFQIALELKAPGLYIGFFPPSLWAHFKTKIMHISSEFRKAELGSTNEHYSSWDFSSTDRILRMRVVQTWTWSSREVPGLGCCQDGARKIAPWVRGQRRELPGSFELQDSGSKYRTPLDILAVLKSSTKKTNSRHSWRKVKLRAVGQVKSRQAHPPPS